MTEPKHGTTEDAFLGGRLRLRQPRAGHRAGHDAILLAAATPAQPGDRVVDFGAGVGTAGLAVASRAAGVEIVLLEIDPGLAELARQNALANGLPAEVIVLDVASSAQQFANAGLPPDSADVVLMNPPFNDPARHPASPDRHRELAHVATPATLEQWVHAARRILKSGGVLSLIWRADALGEILAALDRGFGDIRILPVHADAAGPAIRLLVRATKGDRAPLALYPGLLLALAPHVPNHAAQEILAGRDVLPLARR